MSHTSIVLYFNRNGRIARVIHDDLVATFGEDVVSHSMWTKDYRKAQIGPGGSSSSSNATSHHTDEADAHTHLCMFLSNR
jgi:hypothetical protein